MKFQTETSNTLRVTHFDGEALTFVSPQTGAHHTASSLVLHSDGLHCAWPVSSFEQLHATHFDSLLALGSVPEVVLFGSGAKLRFPHPTLLQSLLRLGIGVETMDTAAACRTFNVLAGEGRKVVGALLLRPQGATLAPVT